MDKEQAYNLARKAIRNAAEWVASARILWGGGRCTVAVSVMVLGCEEIGKAYSLFRYAFNPDASWETMNPWGGNSHRRRLDAYEFETRSLLAQLAVAEDIQKARGVGLDQLEAVFEQELNDKLKERLDPNAGPAGAITEEDFRVLAETLEELLHDHKEAFLRRHEEQFGKDAENTINQASMWIHELRKKMEYVEHDGWSPVEAWEETPEEDKSRIFGGFFSEAAFALAEWHIDLLDRQLRSEWAEISKFIPGSERMAMLRQMFVDGGWAAPASESKS